MGIKANKRRGHAAEGEIGKRTNTWPVKYRMVRTGLDGGHDLRGPHTIGEVKAVKAGPAWLKEAIRQIGEDPYSDEADKNKLIFLKLSNGPGHPTTWWVIQSLDQFESLIGVEDGQA